MNKNNEFNNYQYFMKLVTECKETIKAVFMLNKDNGFSIGYLVNYLNSDAVSELPNFHIQVTKPRDEEDKYWINFSTNTKEGLYKSATFTVIKWTNYTNDDYLIEVTTEANERYSIETMEILLKELNNLILIMKN